MNNLKQIRMLTTNFPVFQGLKGIPLGLLLSILSMWASAQTGPAKDIVFPLGCSLVFICLYCIVHQFYNRIFGTVVRTNKQKIMEGMRGLVGGVIALLAFWVDVSLKPSFSVLGLVFASALLVDYVSVTRQTKEWLLLFYPAAALFMILLSVLPIFGINWWNPLGIKALMYGVCTVVGLLFIVLGVLMHISLEKLLLGTVELSHE